MNYSKIMEVEMQPRFEIIEITSILETILKLDVYCAGDTLVNTALNIPINTIDLYTFIDDRFIPVMLYKLENYFNISIENRNDVDKNTFFEKETYIFKYKEFNCRLIFMSAFKNIEELIRSFDLSIRQIGYFKNKFTITEKAFQGLNNKQIEVENLDLVLATKKSCKYYENLGFEIVNKEELDNLFIDN